MPIYQPRATFSNIGNQSQGGGSADAIGSIAQIFENNQLNSDNANKRKLLEMQMMQAENKMAADAAATAKESRDAASLDEQANSLIDIFTPTLAQPLPEGVQGPVAPARTIEEKLSDPANIGAINKAQINLALKNGIKPADVANLLRSVAAQSGVRDELLQRSFVGAGGKFGVNDAISLDGQAKVAERNQINDLERDQARPRSNNIFVTPGALDNTLPPIGKESTIYGNVEKSTGPASTIASIFANVAGFGGASVAPDVVQARQDADVFSTRLVSALRVSPRFPEGERKELSRIISVEPKTWTSPEVAKQRMISLDGTLADIERKTIDDINDPLVSKDDRQAAASNLRTIREARRKLGVPQDPITSRREDNSLSDDDSGSSDDMDAIDSELEAINRELEGM
ncbi:MAG: hypothetical protein V4721_00420 [Bacteroidota bacterium]